MRLNETGLASRNVLEPVPGLKENIHFPSHVRCQIRFDLIRWSLGRWLILDSNPNVADAVVGLDLRQWRKQKYSTARLPCLLQRLISRHVSEASMHTGPLCKDNNDELKRTLTPRPQTRELGHGDAVENIFCSQRRHPGSGRVRPSTDPTKDELGLVYLLAEVSRAIAALWSAGGRQVR